MGSGSDHGSGGSVVRRMEKRYNAASLVSVAGLVSGLTFWVLIGRLADDGSRAVHVEGPWYAVVCAVPFVATLGAAALVARGRLRWVWVPAAAVALTPVVVALGAALFDGPSSGHDDVIRVANTYLLALPFLVGAAATGRDALAGVGASALAVLALLTASAGSDEVVGGTLVWVPHLLVAVASAAALAARRVVVGWALAVALVLGPVLTAGAALAVGGVGRSSTAVLWDSLVFLPAAVAVLVGVWRETTDPLAGLYALEAHELVVPARRRGTRRATVAEVAPSPPVVSADARR